MSKNVIGLLALAQFTAFGSSSALAQIGTSPVPAVDHAHSTAGEAETLRRLLEGGNVILIRHERTEMRRPDDRNFKVNDCAGQRNLSAAGVASAHQSGEYIRHLRVPIGRVFASPMCRCLETARYMFGKVEAAPALFTDYRTDKREPKTRIGAVRAFVAANLKPGPNTVMVAHHDSGLAFGVNLHEGEALVVGVGADGEPVVVGTMNANRWGDLINDKR